MKVGVENYWPFNGIKTASLKEEERRCQRALKLA